MSRKLLIPFALASFATPLAAQNAAPSPAQTPLPAAAAASAIGPAAGATVYDPAGGVVGTIDSVTATTAVVSTGTAKGALPLSAFAAGPKGPVIGLTKVQLEAAMQQASASSPDKLKAQLVAGAQVKGTGGSVVGTVKASDAQFVTLTTGKGDVRLPMSGFAAGPDGPVVGMTADQLDAAVSSTTAAASTSTTTKTSTTVKTTKTTRKTPKG